MSVTLNVLRYSALGAGVVYGAVHRYNLESQGKEVKAQHQWKQEEKLIKEAKKEYAKLNPAKAPAPSTGSINWEDPNLDFGKVLEGALAKLD